MTARLDRPASQDGLFVWVIHRIAEVFEDHAVIKGGIALRLLDSPRFTTDVDYVFVPYSSKKDIVKRIEAIMAEIEDATVDITLHSQMLRVELRVDDARIQIEASVATECEAIPMATGGFARSAGQPSQVVRVMAPSLALAHKLAAWNERRLLRDLYDCYFLISRVGTNPDMEVLDERLSKVRSRLPKMRKVSRMSRRELVNALREETRSLGEESIRRELAGLLPDAELAGLSLRIRAAIEKLAEDLGA